MDENSKINENLIGNNNKNEYERIRIECRANQFVTLRNDDVIIFDIEATRTSVPTAMMQLIPWDLGVCAMNDLTECAARRVTINGCQIITIWMLQIRLNGYNVQ